MRIFGTGILVSTLFAATSPVALAQSVEDFYRDNTLRIMVGYTPGGAYDVYARLLARHIGKHIPGHPNVIVENMPGAASLILANHLANIAPRDGTVFGAVGRGMLVEPLLGTAEIQYDVQNLTWIGSMGDQVSVCVVWHNVDVDDWREVVEGSKNVIFGGNGVAADNEVFPRMMANLLDANITIISGYPGGAEVALAMETGEIDGHCGTWSAIRQNADWLDGDLIKILVQLGGEPLPELDGAPLVTSFAASPEELQVMNLVLSRLEIAWPYVAPPGIPPERADALRQAFMDAADDPELLAEAAAMGLDIAPMSGSALTEKIVEIYDTPTAIVDATRGVIAP